MDKGKIIRLILIPLTVALAVTLAVRSRLTPSPVDSLPAESTAMVVSIAAKVPVAARTRLTAEQLLLKPIPKSLLTGNEATAIQEVVGQIALVQLEPGEILFNSRVIQEGRGSMPFRIPAGMRAITIRIDELSGVAGHAEPGDLVDLIFFLAAKPPERPVATARVLYEAVVVLGKGVAATPTGGGPEAGKLTSLTLALKPEAAAEVALAEQLGHIKLLLRPALSEANIGRLIMSETGYQSSPSQ